MGITLMEQIGIVAGIVIGVFGTVIGVSGFIYSVLQSRRQRKYELEQAAKQEAFEREQEAFMREQAVREQERAVREQERAAREQEQAVREQEQVAREQERALREQERALREQEQAAHAREQEAEQALRDRLYFLANIIVNTDIPRSSRQIFFDEYIAKGGNGSFVKFWYDEGKAAAKKGTVEEN